jgi:hypothetical protein
MYMGTKQTKITEAGQGCRHCGTPVVERKHTTTLRKKRNKSGYFFSWWLACPNKKCRAIYHVESAKTYYENADAFDLFDAAKFAGKDSTYEAL